jgi:GGDEF domain-containing protein
MITGVKEDKIDFYFHVWKHLQREIQKNMALTEILHRDPLTGLYNRFHMDRKAKDFDNV